MDLNDFISIQKKRILAFAEHWEEQQAQELDFYRDRSENVDWPSKMSHADWEEQFLVFEED